MSKKEVIKTVEKAYDGLDLEYVSKKKKVLTSVRVSEDFDPVFQSVILSGQNLMFITIYPEKVSEQRFADVSNAILRTNCQTIMGALDIDRSDGEVRFRSTIALDGSEPPTEIVKRHIILGFSSMRFFHENVWQKGRALGSPGEDGGLPNESQTYVPATDGSRGFEPMFN